jgi:hypothetical protein
MLQLGPVEDDDAAVMVADQASVPELVGDDGDMLLRAPSMARSRP